MNQANLSIFRMLYALLMATLIMIKGGFAVSIQESDTLHVHNDMYVSSGEILEISAGTVVYFHGYYHISIEGALEAEGSASNPVIFTAADTTGIFDTHLNAGGWNGLRFTLSEPGNKEAPSLLRHCIFEFAKASKEDFHHGGAVSVYGEREIAIEDCTFRYNYAYRMGGAVYLNQNNGNISRCNFFYNQACNLESEIFAYGGGLFTYQSRPVVEWSVFENNDASGMGGAMAFEESHPVVSNNIVTSNDAPLGGGIGFLRMASANLLVNNLINHNTAMFFGGGVAFVDASAVFFNCNILNNYAGYGGGLYFNEISSPKFYNTIIRGNRMYPDTLNQVWIFDGVSGPHFYNCNVEGGLDAFYGVSEEEYAGDYLDNIDEDPLFENAAEMNFLLLENSPCIDAGFQESAGMGVPNIDLAGHDRFSGIKIDMGAFEYQDPYNYFSLNIAVTGEGSTEPEKGEHFYREGEEVTLTAIPATNWIFDSWTTPDGAIHSQEMEVEMLQDMTVTAIFTHETDTETAEVSAATVFPNPVSDQLTLKLPQHLLHKEITVSLFSLTGEKIFENAIIATQQMLKLPFNFSPIPNGVYILEVVLDDNKYLFKVFR